VPYVETKKEWMTWPRFIGIKAGCTKEINVSFEKIPNKVID
jgi:hypothetical protein